MNIKIASAVCALCSLTSTSVMAQSAGQYSEWWKILSGQQSAQAVGLDQTEIAKGLRAALSQGTARAVERLGRENGFWGNEELRIPLPGALARGAQAFGKFGGAQLLNEFQLTLNRAAEQAIPATAQILGDAVTALTLEDARNILTGPQDAATQYFRRVSSDELEARILPIVSKATAEVGVTETYKRINLQTGGLMELMLPNGGNLDNYVTAQAMEGLFTVIAAEELRIRENPAARSSEILRKVFAK